MDKVLRFRSRICWLAGLNLLLVAAVFLVLGYGWFNLWRVYGAAEARSGALGMAAIGLGLLLALAAIGSWLRALTGRTAVAIRPDGILINGLVTWHFIPWAAVRRLHLNRPWVPGREGIPMLRIEADAKPGSWLDRYPPGIRATSLDASEAQVMAWIDAANAARPPTPRG